MLVEGGGPGDAAQPAQSHRVEWSTIPTAAVGGTTLEALVVGSVEPNEMMGGTGDTGFQVRPCPNPCGARMWPALRAIAGAPWSRAQHMASLPSDGVIEHRAIIAPQTPPRERRKEKAAQAEEARAEWSAIPRSSASAEAAPEVGAAVSAKVKRPYSEVSAKATALLTQRRSSAPTARYPSRASK